jgi:hypothetical protein
MKTIQFIYQDTEIHFAFKNEGNVMVNATEMAKLFSKRTGHYLVNKDTKLLIEAFKRADISAQIIDDRGRNGIYFERKLALDFAAWLDVDFRVWVFSTIDKILFGHYKEHWDAHQLQTSAEDKMKELKPKLLKAPTPELVFEYFEAEQVIKNAKNLKRKAIANQYKIDFA